MAFTNIKDRIKKEKSVLEQEIRGRIAGYIVGAFGLVAGLAWNDAIQTLINSFFPYKSQTVMAKFIYAAAMTFVIVIVSVYVVRFLKKETLEQTQNEKK